MSLIVLFLAVCIAVSTAILDHIIRLQDDVNQTQMRVNEVVKERIDALKKRSNDDK